MSETPIASFARFLYASQTFPSGEVAGSAG